MQYYIQIPFRSARAEGEADAWAISDEILIIHGVTFLRITGRQYDRITRDLRRQGWPHQMTALADPNDGPEPDNLVTLLMPPTPGFPGLPFPPNLE